MLERSCRQVNNEKPSKFPVFAIDYNGNSHYLKNQQHGRRLMAEAEIKIETGVPLPPAPTRDRSTIEFPYTAMDTAIEIAKAVHEVGGQSCQWDQLGAKLDMAADGGGFRQRVATAKTFGLITYGGGIVSLTPLGIQINDPAQTQSAKVASFLTVPLYKKIYEEYKNGTLPGTAGLETAMVTMGVAPKQKDKARQAFTKSANEAGFFAFGSNRLVLPALKPAAETVKPTTLTPPDPKHLGGGGGEPPSKPPSTQHPFIEGLLNKLPKADTPWSLADRKKWLQTASNIFDLMYTTAPDDGGELTIALKTNSAN
jgi:hypothetical protein